MAIKRCLYCDNEISEFADPCPKCKAKHPHDDGYKSAIETSESHKRKIEAVLNSTIGCAECGSLISIRSLLGFVGQSCAHCGFSKNFLKCYLCGAPADSYDPVEDKYICEEHPRCYVCKKRFKKEKLIIRRLGKYRFSYCCKSCANPVEYLFKAFWQKIVPVPGISKKAIYLRRPPPQPKLAKPAPETNETVQEPLNQTDVVRFFLNLYRQQVGADPSTPAEFTQLTEAGSGSNRVYELRVKQASDWARRRMTIGSHGDESSSKGKCYYVIFDKPIIVKIPPQPIQDFEAYVASLQKEESIVERLTPKKCITPKVSAILSQVHPLPSETETTAGQLEEKYLAWLRQNPSHQSYLKIKNTFAYFMDLSQYYFLSHILDSFHDLAPIFPAELTSATELVHSPSKFRERYGDDHVAVGSEIRELYHLCEADIRQLLTRSGKASAATGYRIRSWFVGYLKEKEIGGTDVDLPTELVNGVTSIFAQQFEKYREPVKAYTRLIRSVARRQSLEKNGLPIVGIITHLLDLLAWLDLKKVAMRGLTPDNLLVAGDSQNYPAFLRSPADYSLGFIDLETAICLNHNQQFATRQLLLEGTPYYATPSHLFPNSTLEACFRDTARVLHFQDWQAVIVMIFNAVTGELLFDRTAKQFPEIRERVARAMDQTEALEGALEAASRMFWRSATAEFRDKMKAAERLLRWVEADLPKQVKALFVQALKREIEFIHADIEKRIETQTWFAALKSREQLRASSHHRIYRIMEELKADSQAGTRPTASFLGGASFLKDLAALKAQAERKTRLASRLESGAVSRMSAYDLLTLMFSSVLHVMYCRQWNDPGEESTVVACPADDESCMTTTVGALPVARKNPTPYAHFAVAKTLLYQRRYDEAIANGETAIALDPNYPDGYFMLGVIQTFAGKSAEAVDYFKRAMRLDSNNTSSYLYYLGLAHYCLKKYDIAVTSLEKAVKLNPQYGPWPLAITYAQLDRGQEAADILANYFDKRRWPVFFIENTFKSWPFKERKDMDHWAEGLRKSGLMRPWNPVYRREYEKAIADAEEAITRNPNDANAQYTMGESLVFSGRSANALDYLETALRLDPEYPGHYVFILGLAQFCLERYPEAAASLEICLYKRKMHSNPPMWLLAATFAYLGRQSEAEDVLTKYISENGFEGYTVERVLKYYLHAFKDPKDIDRFAQGLQKSGLPRN